MSNEILQSREKEQARGDNLSRLRRRRRSLQALSFVLIVAMISVSLTVPSSSVEESALGAVIPDGVSEAVFAGAADAGCYYTSYGRQCNTTYKVKQCFTYGYNACPSSVDSGVWMWAFIGGCTGGLVTMSGKWDPNTRTRVRIKAPKRVQDWTTTGAKVVLRGCIAGGAWSVGWEYWRK